MATVHPAEGVKHDRRVALVEGGEDGAGRAARRGVFLLAETPRLPYAHNRELPPPRASRVVEPPRRGARWLSVLSAACGRTWRPRRVIGERFT